MARIFMILLATAIVSLLKIPIQARLMMNNICYNHLNIATNRSQAEIVCQEHETCCGTCNNRFCCSNPSLELDQNKCLDYCSEYYDSLDKYQSGQVCEERGSFCCGSCDNRFCCSLVDRKLDETKCIERCKSFQTLYGSIFNAKMCTTSSPYCCGECTRRICCSDIDDRLNQNECKPPSDKIIASLIMISSLSGITILLCLIICFIKLLFKTKLMRGPVRNRTNRNNESTRRPSIDTISYLDPDPNLQFQMFNYNDRPPSYDTIDFKKSESSIKQIDRNNNDKTRNSAYLTTIVDTNNEETNV